jgi:hypothetical protein
MQALEEGRRRALLEQRLTDRAIALDKERLALRTHVLTLREGEMQARLQDRDRSISELESRVQMLTGMLQKEQASRNAVARRLSVVETELLAARQMRISPPKRTTGTMRRKRVVGQQAAKRNSVLLSKKRKSEQRLSASRHSKHV